MKAIILIAILGIFLSQDLEGQNKKEKVKSGEIPDTVVPKPEYADPFIIKPFEWQDYDRKPGIRPLPIPDRRQFRIIPPEIKGHKERIMAEMFPGSKKFYAKRPYIIQQSDKSFFRTPDSTSKYYLIIKDPILNRRVDNDFREAGLPE